MQLYTSQQNEVVERRNCTIVEKIQYKLLYGKIPTYLWLKVAIKKNYWRRLFQVTNFISII